MISLVSCLYRSHCSEHQLLVNYPGMPVAGSQYCCFS